MERALITGAAGFIGSHLAAELLRQGWFVTGLDTRSPASDPVAAENLPARLARSPVSSAWRSWSGPTPERTLPSRSSPPGSSSPPKHDHSAHQGDGSVPARQARPTGLPAGRAPFRRSLPSMSPSGVWRRP
jgi:NAD(P)-dependent dehydrogenase (short-subunit alcohol dehydrogenase family)